MVKLRLRRKGKTHYPVYDIVALDSRKKRDGAYIERLGYYDPHSSPSTIKIDTDRAIYWLNVGAQATPLVRELMSYEGILLRRTLQFKGKSEEEIAAEVEKHQVVARERYHRRKELRKQKAIAKAKEKEAEEKAETGEK